MGHLLTSPAMRPLSLAHLFRGQRSTARQDTQGGSAADAPRTHPAAAESFYIGPPLGHRLPQRPDESASPSAMRPRASLQEMAPPTRLPGAAGKPGAASGHSTAPAEVLGALTTIPLVPLGRISGMTGPGGTPRHPHVVGAFARGASLQPIVPGEPMPWDHTRLSVDVLATSSDGAVRRYPPLSDGRRDLMATGTICDIPAAHVKQRIGGIELTPDRQSAAFMVNGRPVPPLKLGRFQGHPLPDGKLLVLQPDQDQGAMACALMLLLDQGHLTPGRADRFQPEEGHRAASLQGITGQLKAMTGQEPVVVSHEANFHQFGRRHAARNAFWKAMADRIGTLGPAILNRGRGHVMLDNVRKEGGSYRITIRDPFHGTCVEFKDTHDFFKDLDHSEGKATLDAVFLPRR